MADEKMRGLDEGISARLESGDKEGEALLRSERAVLFAKWELWEEASIDFERVGVIALEYEQTAPAAQAFGMQGNMLAYDAAAWDRAAAAYEKSALLYEEVDDGVLAAQAWRQMAAYYISKGEGETAVPILQRAIALLNGEDDGELLEKLYGTLGQVSLASGEYGEVTAVLQQAQSQLGNTTSLEMLEQRRHVLQGMASGDLSLAEAWETALPMMQEMGWMDEALSQAMTAYNEERWADTVHFTAETRLAAREEEGMLPLLRYVMASMLLADAQEKQGNRVSVLVALLTTRAVVVDELGEQGGASIDRTLDALAERWGEDGMARAVAGYQEYVVENGRFEV